MSIPSNQTPRPPVVHAPAMQGRADVVEGYRAAWDDMIAAMAAMQRTVTGLHHRIEALERTQHLAAAPDPPAG